MKILLTGATGFVGSAIATELLARGHHVTGLVRTPAKAAALVARGMVPLPGDMLVPASYVPAVAQAEVVIHAAQLAQAGRFTNTVKGKVNEADALMTNALADACQVHGAKLLYTSGCFNYGDHGAAWITESTPATPSPLGEGHQARVLDLLARHRRAGLRTTIITAGFVYGPGGLFKSAFYDQLRQQQLRVLGSGTNYWSPVHVTDLATAFALATEQRHEGENFNVVDDAPLPLRELVDILTTAQGVSRVGSIPPWLLGLLIGGPLVKSLTSSFRVSNAKSKQLLGWQPRYSSFADGIGPVLQELNQLK